MQFAVVTFYTLGTVYAALESEWADSLRRHGIEHFAAYAEDSCGEWERNTNLKPKVIFQAWEELDCPIVWLDIDARLRARPDLFWELAESEVDFACHYLRRRHRGELLSGTLYFGQTERAGQLIRKWLGRSQAHSRAWDQRNLQDAVPQIEGLETRELPAEYCAIDFMHVKHPVVFHHQLSRQTRRGRL